jgi:hypothetical protein
VRSAHIGLVLALAATMAAVGAHAEGNQTVQVVAHDDASTCVADRAPCYVIEGDWSLVEAGSELVVSFENNASREHALNLAAGANASDERNTSRADAFAQLGPVDPGQTVEATVEIPLGTDTAYLFCHLGDHEAEGLHLLRNVYPPGSVEQARNRGPGLEDPNESPAPLAGLLAGLAAAALIVRRTP